VPILGQWSTWSQPLDWRARMATARGWDQGAGAPEDAQVANAYGQWADRLYLCLAVLFLPGAVGDFFIWVGTGSLISLLGPAMLLGLCIAYLNLRRRFRRSVRVADARSGARFDP
jgi:hypothetical protein